MSNFKKKRIDTIKKKNEIYLKAEQYDAKANDLVKKKVELNASKAKVLDNIPEEIKEEVKAVYDKRETELDDESKKMEKEIYDESIKAQGAVDEMYKSADDLKKSSKDMHKLKDVPLVGTFLEKKSIEASDQAEQMIDLAKEARGYEDKLVLSRNKILNKN